MWNNELATIAERWGAQCIFGHDKCRDTGDGFKICSINVQVVMFLSLFLLLVLYPVGQNLARGNLATNNELSLVDEWYDDVVYFNKDEIANFIM